MDISLQLYSIKEDIKENFAGALELVQKAGYQGVEFAGYFGNSPARMKALLDGCHLKAVSTHLGLPRLREALDEEIAVAKTLGYRLLVCPGISADSAEGYANDARLLEECAQKAAKEGIIVGYHNHSHEFATYGGKYAQDIILENAPTVKFQPDLFWIAVGGVDPLSYLEPLARAGRICAVHAKELARTGKENVYVGEGKIDFTGVAKLCPPDQYPWIIEQEEYHSSHVDGISKSYQGLRRIFDSLNTNV
ncbi:MAG: sugar phosphate isomerase/epimerase [Treponema sp.]|jgi:sugar phosphate isomerase/epimerase|nr:sugar phosphate isomerase/epimerase [Treponema sp.]